MFTIDMRCGRASSSAPDPKGSKATVESIIKEAMHRMKNTANKILAKVKNFNVSITGKVKLGFVEIAVAPMIVLQAQN